MNLSAPGLEIRDAGSEGVFKIGQVNIQGEGALLIDALWASPGKSEMTIESIDLAFPAALSQVFQAGMGPLWTTPDAATKAGQPFRLSIGPLRITSDASIREDLLDSTGRFETSARFNDVRLDKIEMQVSLKRLHHPTLSRVMRNMSKATFNCEALKSPTAATVQSTDTAEVLKFLAQFLVHNPEYSLDMLRVSSGGQDMTISYSAGTTGVTEQDILGVEPAMLMAALIPKAVLKADAKVPIAWIEKMQSAVPGQLKQAAQQPQAVEAMLDNAVSRGWILRDGGHIYGKASFSDGRLLFNGKPF